MTFDELASMVVSGKLNPKLVIWVKEEFSNQFAETFVCGANETFTLKPTRNIAMERWMNLDGPVNHWHHMLRGSIFSDIVMGANIHTHSTFSNRNLSCRSVLCQVCARTYPRLLLKER